jgi:DNA-binding transcriptional LysR family regulator
MTEDGMPTAWGGIELREIRVFLALARELHFARTAERLGITPSYVSQTIRTLEVRIGGKLFERTSRRVRLTTLGEQLASELADPYRQLRDVLIRAREVATGVAGELRIGIYAISAGPHMPDIVRTFEARHPHCKVRFVNVGYERSYVDVLRAGEIDMLATRLPLTAPDVTGGPILSHEGRVAVVAKDDPLAERASISYEDLAERAVGDVPLFPREMMDALIPPATPSGRTLKRIANDGTEDTLMRVALGIQVHPTVPSFLHHYSHLDVTSVPIRDLPPSETGLAWLTENRSPKISAFARAAADVLAHTELAVHQPGANRTRSNRKRQPA